jgi:outer membrane protein OmpA-like peptidoglycan-associated protein
MAAGALLALSLGGCGGSKDKASADQATMDSASGAGSEAGGMGAAGGASGGAGGIGATGGAAGASPSLAGVATTSQALTTYLGGTGADAAGRAFPLEQVTFASGASTLDAASQSALGEVAAVLKQHPNASVTITSYADPQGDAAANKKLAAARAVSVKNALSAAGVPAAKLMTNVVGETGSAPIAENRRVELLVKRG